MSNLVSPVYKKRKQNQPTKPFLIAHLLLFLFSVTPEILKVVNEQGKSKPPEVQLWDVTLEVATNRERIRQADNSSAF